MAKGFVFGIIDTFTLKESDDLVVVGRVNGKVEIGDSVFVTNPGDASEDPFETTVKGIEISVDRKWQGAPSAEDQLTSLRLEKGATANIRRASVVYTKSTKKTDIHDAYLGAIGDAYVMKLDLAIPDEELNEMCFTDLCEAWKLYFWYHFVKNPTTDRQEIPVKRDKMLKVAMKAAEKLLQLDEVCVIFSKATGEPYMFSKTIQTENGYFCAPPNIRVIPVAYKDVYEEGLPKDMYEVKVISNGKDKRGIFNFLGTCFFLNGANGVEFISEETVLSSQSIIPNPDFSSMAHDALPIMNPGVERWMLLLGQLPAPKKPEQKLIFNLYFGFLAEEVTKAKFLIPSKGDKPKEDIKPGSKVQMEISLTKGRGERNAVMMYTDWNQLRKAHGDEWNAVCETVEHLIDKFDVVINSSDFIKSSCYLDEEDFSNMKKLVKDRAERAAKAEKQD